MSDITSPSTTSNNESWSLDAFKFNPEVDPFFPGLSLDDVLQYAPTFDDAAWAFQPPQETLEEKTQRLESEIRQARKESEDLRRDVDILEGWVRKIYNFVTLRPIMINGEGVHSKDEGQNTAIHEDPASVPSTI